MVAAKVTLDTNVYVAAFQFGGMRLLHMAVVKEDEPDNRILECAVEAGSDFIISADKDLLRLGSYVDIPVVRPVDFLKCGLER